MHLEAQYYWFVCRVWKVAPLTLLSQDEKPKDYGTFDEILLRKDETLKEFFDKFNFKKI